MVISCLAVTALCSCSVTAYVYGVQEFLSLFFCIKVELFVRDGNCTTAEVMMVTTAYSEFLVLY